MSEHREPISGVRFSKVGDLALIPASTERQRLRMYVDLFGVCFPGSLKYSERYLHWLYAENPCGEVVGVDAFSGERLAAHYAVVPVELTLGGQRFLAHWSLNTATHPDFQGRGLFTKLAGKTYEMAKAKGSLCIVGVANDSSTPGFVRKLGFTIFGPMSVSLGYGSIRLNDPENVLHRHWTAASLGWRLRNPSHTYFSRVSGAEASIFACQGPTHIPVLLGYGDSSLPAVKELAGLPLVSVIQPRLQMGFSTTARGISVPFPPALAPSPWNVIFLPFAQALPTAARLGIMAIDLDTF